MIKIGDKVFDVPAPKGMTSFALQQKILPIAGNVVALFLHALGGKQPSDLNEFMEKDVLKVLPIVLPHLGNIFSSMPPGELESISRTMLGNATCNKLPLFGGSDGDPFDALMQGKTIDTWKLLWHALGVWYPDFLSLVNSLPAKSAVENPSRESSISDATLPATA